VILYGFLTYKRITAIVYITKTKRLVISAFRDIKGGGCGGCGGCGSDCNDDSRVFE